MLTVDMAIITIKQKRTDPGNLEFKQISRLRLCSVSLIFRASTSRSWVYGHHGDSILLSERFLTH
jgi:hypothetical protein